jgi:hypothetical protein
MPSTTATEITAAKLHTAATLATTPVHDAATVAATKAMNVAAAAGVSAVATTLHALSASAAAVLPAAAASSSATADVLLTCCQWLSLHCYAAANVCDGDAVSPVVEVAFEFKIANFQNTQQ